MSDISDEKFYNSSDISRKLDISESTLRKYSLILEKSGWLFAKTEKGGRTFTENDIELFQMFLRLKNEMSMSLEKSADMSVSYIRSSDTLTRDVASSIDSALQVHNENKIIQEMRHVYQKMEENQKLLKDRLEEAENKAAAKEEETQKLLKEILDNQNKSFFRKIFPKKKIQ